MTDAEDRGPARRDAKADDRGPARRDAKANRLRLFVAVGVPAERLQAVAAAMEPFRARWPGARWTEPANQHVTLKFLGWAPAEQLDAVESACAAVASKHAPSELALGELDAFPGKRRVRVLWVGLDDPAQVLSGAAGDLDRALEPLGFEAEKRSFTPHLTLARMRTPVRTTGEWPEVRMDATPWTAGALTLWRSHLSPKGARYEALKAFPLGHAAP